MHAESLSRRVLAGLFGVHRTEQLVPSTASIAAHYSLRRRVLAGLLGVALPGLRTPEYPGSVPARDPEEMGRWPGHQGHPEADQNPFSMLTEPSRTAKSFVARRPVVLPPRDALTFQPLPERLGLAALTARYESIPAHIRLKRRMVLQSHRSAIQKALGLIRKVLPSHAETGVSRFQFDRARAGQEAIDNGFAISSSFWAIKDGVGHLASELEFHDLAEDIANCASRYGALAREIRNDLDTIDGLGIDDEEDTVVAAWSAFLSKLLAAHDDLEAADAALSVVADDFRGADLTETYLSLQGIDLTGIRWNLETQWPSQYWAERMRHASTEDPRDVGTYVVQSHGDPGFSITLQPDPLSPQGSGGRG